MPVGSERCRTLLFSLERKERSQNCLKWDFSPQTPQAGQTGRVRRGGSFEMTSGSCATLSAGKPSGFFFYLFSNIRYYGRGNCASSYLVNNVAGSSGVLLPNSPYSKRTKIIALHVDKNRGSFSFPSGIIRCANSSK